MAIKGSEGEEREGRIGKGIMKGIGKGNLRTTRGRKENTVRRELAGKWAWLIFEMHSSLHSFLPSFTDIHTDLNKADLSDKTAP